MGKGFGNDFFKELSKTVFDTEWMSGLYGSKRNEQKKVLKQLFTQVSDNNVTKEEKDVLMAKTETVQDRVERLEAKMAVLEEALAQNQAEINKQAKAIVNLVAQSEKESDELEKSQENLVERATRDVFYYLERGEIGPDAVVSEIRKRIEGDSAFSMLDNKLLKTLDKLDSKKAEVASIVSEADKWITQRNILEAQYGATKSTYELLGRTVKQVGNNSGSYTNSDFNTTIPTYSPQKVDVVSKFSENPLINVETGENTAYVEGTSEPNSTNIASVKEKYKALGLLNPKRTKNSASYENGAVKVLGQALKAGLVEDLAAAGLDANQALDFFVENFKGAYILRMENGLVNIPPGHDSKSKQVYDSLYNKIKNYGSSFQGAQNTWDPNKGNTISTNNQIASLAENYETIFSEMKNAGFTFKEAMYAMFDSENGMFKDSGVVYDVNKQTEKPNYFITAAGDKETAKMYQEMAQSIYEKWGVKPFTGASVEQYDPKIEDTTDANEKIDLVNKKDRTDPLSFDLGDENNTFSFIIDRDKSNSFDGKNEFVGADSQTNWLEDMRTFDTDGNGIIEGDELKNVMLLNTKFQDDASQSVDNNEYTPDKTAVNKDYKRATTTDVDYSLINAADLGIASIDLTGLDEAQVGQTTGIFDVNGSEKFNDSFKLTMQDGSEVIAKRKDETSEYMDKVYGGVYGKATKLGISEEKVDNTLEKNYGEFDEFDSAYGSVLDAVNVLKNVGNTAAEAKQERSDAIDDIQKHKETELIQAGNKAATYKNVNSWSSIRNSVMAIVRAEGLPENEEQLEGIHVLEGTMDAREIVEIYKEQLKQEEEYNTKQNVDKEVWKSLIKVTESGLAATADEIREMLTSGQAKTADDVVRILAEIQQGVEVKTQVMTLGFDSEREKEIYETFNAIFNEAGRNDDVVEALAMLCELQRSNPNYMQDKTAEQLAKDVMNKMSK